jgi:hypothetical protein
MRSRESVCWLTLLEDDLALRTGVGEAVDEPVACLQFRIEVCRERRKTLKRSGFQPVDPPMAAGWDLNYLFP